MKRKIALIFLAAVVLVAVFHAPIFRAMAGYLVQADPPEKADVVYVLAGDGYGHRILRGAELVKQGYAPKVVVSGPSGTYGAYECDLAIPFAVKAGYPESYFIHFEHDARSTREESQDAADQLRKLGAKHVLLVTSDFHTRRTRRNFSKAAPDLRFTVVSAPDEYFTVDGWWHNREAQKTFLVEWEKTIATWFGL